MMSPITWPRRKNNWKNSNKVFSKKIDRNLILQNFLNPMSSDKLQLLFSQTKTQKTILYMNRVSIKSSSTTFLLHFHHFQISKLTAKRSPSRGHLNQKIFFGKMRTLALAKEQREKFLSIVFHLFF